MYFLCELSTFIVDFWAIFSIFCQVVYNILSLCAVLLQICGNMSTIFYQTPIIFCANKNAGLKSDLLMFFSIAMLINIFNV